jgi:prepilin-type N-terminal cleavage/methylation domain-containing protein
VSRSASFRCAGFTLVEILVALLILSIMSALGYGAYRGARISAERTEESLQRSREIEFGMRVMMQDFIQAAPRPVRDIQGSALLPAMHGTAGAGTVSNPNSGSGFSSGSSSFNSSSNFNSSSSSSFGGTSGSGAVQSIIDLTRMGWSNTAGQQRGTLQRVSYALVDDVLKRSYQVNLDTVQQNKPTIQDLMKGVKGIQFRYLDLNQTWQNNWPLGTGPADLVTRPAAVEVVIEFKDWGRVRRVFEVAG